MTEQQGDGPAAHPGRIVDVAIAGAGIVGLSVALAIRSGTALPCTITLCDPALTSGTASPPTLRALAIAADARRFLSRLGVWQTIEARTQPMTAMELTDSRVGAVPAPVFLTFEEETEDGAPFAHMVFHDALRDALLTACRERGILEVPHGLRAASPQGSAMRVETDDGAGFRARLLVAADGGRSRLREQAGIATVGWDYGQAAIVATLAHEVPHHGRAVQHFLPAGPLALLPLRAEDGSERRTSIVWTEERTEAERLAALPGPAFVEALQARIGHVLGPIRLEDRPRATPLRVALARRLVAARLALAGDAARTIHPLAGQGLNLGLRDAAVLGRTVAEALDLGLDPASRYVLEGYQQARRPAAAAMAAVTDGLNRLFSNDVAVVRALRDLGLGLVDRAPALKRRFVQEAAGEAND